MSDFKISVYKSLDNDLAGSWERLWQKSDNAHFFNSFVFFLICAKTFPGENYEIFCLKKNGNIVAILPLIKKRIFGIYSYTSPGGRFLEKSALLVKNNDKDQLKILIDFVLDKGNLNINELSSETANILSDLYPESVTSIISVNPFIDLRSEDYIGLKKKDLSKMKNRIRKNSSNLEHVHFRGNVGRILDLVIDLEKRSHKSTKGREIFDDKSSINFYKNLFDICKGNVAIDLLKYKKDPFVSAIGVICKDRYYACHTCYLREYKYFIPGKMLTYFMLKKLKEEGIQVFDFVRGFTKFKEDYTRNFAIQYDFYLSYRKLVNLWWRVINYLRRLRISVMKTKYSKDYLYLFKTL